MRKSEIERRRWDAERERMAEERAAYQRMQALEAEYKADLANPVEARKKAALLNKKFGGFVGPGRSTWHDMEKASRRHHPGLQAARATALAVADVINQWGKGVSKLALKEDPVAVAGQVSSEWENDANGWALEPVSKVNKRPNH